MYRVAGFGEGGGGGGEEERGGEVSAVQLLHLQSPLSVIPT